MTIIKYYKNKCISLSASTGPGLIVQPGLPLLPSPSYPAQVCDTSRAAAGPAPGQSHTDSAGGKPWRFWERFSHTISTAWFQFTEERFLVITQPQMQPFSCFFFFVRPIQGIFLSSSIRYQPFHKRTTPQAALHKAHSAHTAHSPTELSAATPTLHEGIAFTSRSPWHSELGFTSLFAQQTLW